MAIVLMVHPCGTSMTMLVNSYILLQTLQYADYMILLEQPRLLNHIAGVPHVNLNLKCRFAKLLYKAKHSHNKITTSLSYYACITLFQSLAIVLCEFNINMSQMTTLYTYWSLCITFTVIYYIRQE